MDFSEKWGKDVETATALALEELKCSRDEVEVIVLEEPSRGFLGLGSKLAKVRVEIKKEEKNSENELQSSSEKKSVSDNIENLHKSESEPVIVKDEIIDSSVKNSEKSAKDKNSEESRFSRPEDLIEVNEHIALNFLKETTQKMGLNLNFKVYVNESSVYVDIEGRDAGTIIGKRGQTLDAIQYLTSLVVNKQNEGYMRVVLDAENYRAKREKTLERLADRLAQKVVKTKRSVKLEPMNPYERMVIHASLSNNPKVTTRSEGEEPYRRVVIELK